jgi:hypothetical protein
MTSSLSRAICTVTITSAAFAERRELVHDNPGGIAAPIAEIWARKRTAEFRNVAPSR